MSNGNNGINRRQEMEDLTDYINNGWLHSGEFDGPTFLWNQLIREASHEDERNRNNVPVAPFTDADNVISMPMQWYFDSIAAIVPTAERNETGVEIPGSTCLRSVSNRRRCLEWTRWSAMRSSAHAGLTPSQTLPRPWK